MSFSKTLKRLLDEKNLSQAELCRLTGIPTSLMSNYVKGIKSPTLTNSLKLAKAFEISMDELSGSTSDLSTSKIDAKSKNGSDRTILSTTELPVMAKYRQLAPDEQARVDSLIDALWATHDIARNTEKKPIPDIRDELLELLVSKPIRIPIVEHVLQLDAEGLERFQKILDIVEALPISPNNEADSR